MLCVQVFESFLLIIFFSLISCLFHDHDEDSKLIRPHLNRFEDFERDDSDAVEDRNSAEVPDCHKFHHRNLSHEVVRIASGPTTHRHSHFAVTLRGTEWVSGNILTISEPSRLLTVELPNADSCTEGILDTVKSTADKHDCEIAVNAGLFDERSGGCLGNIVHESKILHDSEGLRNAHFGITRDLKLFFGYLNEDTLKLHQFKELVGGVIWLVKNSTVFVSKSLDLECSKTQTTGRLEDFVSVKSARTAVGNDVSGNVMIVQVDGKTQRSGVNLYDFADILRRLGFVNAINLDGGGSSALVINGTRVGVPSDYCEDSSMFVCPRKISSILCAKRKRTQSVRLPSTSTLSPITTDEGIRCEPPCLHGLCVSGKCKCLSGFYGPDCSAQQSPCLNGGTFLSGVCKCTVGFVGDHCESVCPHGYYGDQCKRICVCPTDQPVCNASDGSCSKLTAKDCSGVGSHSAFGSLLEISSFLKKEYEHSGNQGVLIVVLFLFFCLSLLLNIILLCKVCRNSTCCRRNKNRFRHKSPNHKFSKLASDHNDSEDALL